MSRNHKAVGRTGEISRRGFIGRATTAAAAALAVGPAAGARAWASSSPGYLLNNLPDSKFGNVQIGANTYSYRSLPRFDDPETVIGYLVLSGISSVELRGQLILDYLGAPSPMGIPTPNQIAAMADAEEREAARRRRAAYEAELGRFYASPPLEKLADLRKLFEDAGVDIHLVRLAADTPEAADFAFRVARALGARGNAQEIGEEAVRLQGATAARYGLVAAMHNHNQPAEPDWPGFDHFLALSPGATLEFDVGHYYGATGQSPIPEMIRLHDRITSLHLKDRAPPEDGGANLPWGIGGTPLPQILRLMHRENYDVVAHIELEYPIPEGSDAVLEVRKCVEFCRDVLTRYIATGA